jgi:hypothetical protein
MIYAYLESHTKKSSMMATQATRFFHISLTNVITSSAYMEVRFFIPREGRLLHPWLALHRHVKEEGGEGVSLPQTM